MLAVVTLGHLYFDALYLSTRFIFICRYQNIDNKYLVVLERIIRCILVSRAHCIITPPLEVAQYQY